jgi:hypothetical protein
MVLSGVINITMARPKGKRKQARISVSFEDSDYAMLGALARRHNVSTAWMVRQAVQDLIERERSTPENLELPLLPRGSRRNQASA